MVIKVPLTQGKEALIDEVDADLLDLKWHAARNHKSQNYYARRYVRHPKRTTAPMHRTVLERKLGRALEPHEVPDHIDGNGLNNTRDNLRPRTHKQNAANRRGHQRNHKSNGLPHGVYPVNKSSRYQAILTYKNDQGQRVCQYLGSYDTPDEAHEVFRLAHARLHGDSSPYYADASDADDGKGLHIEHMRDGKVMPYGILAQTRQRGE